MMKYIIMCGGQYAAWETPRQLTIINGESIVERSVRLLRSEGVEDIAISSTNTAFAFLGVPLLMHRNDYVQYDDAKYWVDAFYPMSEPVCYIWGDVFFSPEAIHTIVTTDTESVSFYASVPPFSGKYIKPWAEPFAMKVRDTRMFFRAVERTKKLQDEGAFNRVPIAWELWNVINGYNLNMVNYDGIVAINDYTCDIDTPEDVERIKGVI